MRTQRARVIQLILQAILLIWAAPGLVAAQSNPDHGQAAIDQLRMAVTPQRDGSHMRALAALRQLRDPGLKPLFERLLQSENWPMHVHAVLGLAEIDPQGKIDVALIDQIAPDAHESVIATGLDLKLITPDQLETVLDNENLAPMARLFALAELVSLKRPVNREQLAALAQSGDVHIGGLAAALLAQLGDAGPFTQFTATYAQSIDGQRSESIEPLVWLLEAQRRYVLSACAPWVTSLIASADMPPEFIARCILTLLELDPKAGAQAWQQELGAEATYQKRVRMGLLLLANVKNVPPELFDKLRGSSTVAPDDEPLMAGLIRAGQAAAGKQNQSEPLRELIALRHVRSAEWVMTHLKDVPPNEAAPVYEFLLDRLKDGAEHENDAALAIEAATRLFEIKPDSLLSRLVEAEDDSALQQSIVLGLLERANASVVETATKIRRIGSGRADSLVLLLIAKHSPQLSDTDRAQLGVMAAGGGRLSDALEIQAAWLYVKHSGQAQSAVAQLFAAPD